MGYRTCALDQAAFEMEQLLLKNRGLDCPFPMAASQGRTMGERNDVNTSTLY